MYNSDPKPQFLEEKLCVSLFSFQGVGCKSI